MTELVLRAVVTRSSGFTLDVDLSLGIDDRTRVVGVLGPSGSGKTTLLAALAGLVRPRSGHIAIGDRVLFCSTAGIDLPPQQRGIGLVAQDGLLFPHLDVAANLDFGARRRRADAAPDRTEVIDVLRLSGLLARRPHELSGGERQRVALGRALLSGSELLALDEPVSALDDVLRFQVLDLIDRVTSAFELPALYVGHRSDELLRLAGRGVRLERGTVVDQGPISAVVAASGVVGAVPNLLTGEIDAEDGHRLHVAAGTTLHLPLARRPGERVWCRISSGAITLERDSPASPGRASARNRLHGTIRHLEDALEGGFQAGRDLVRALVDVGVPLQVDLTHAAVASLRLAEGDAVHCVFKAHAIDVLG